MSFASFEYGVLLSTVFVLYWALGRRPLARLTLLLLASYLFYGWWKPSYLLLIAGSSLLDYIAGQRIAVATRTQLRKLWLIVSLIGNLGLLGLFKYYNFASRSITAVLRRLGASVSTPTLKLILPAGISFYTFQSMSYTIDIYRGELAPAPHALAFLVFVAFFPQLVAGPIVRARYFLPQLTVDPSLDPQAGGRGLWLIALGLIKKLAIADLLAVNLVDRVFETPQLYSSTELLLGVYGYALQIYCDFSAYSDIAIGSALLLGLQLPPNFNRPYAASDLRDFWRRWHISLSTWLRDYLYVPLGGSRGSPWRTYRNLMLTMLLGGLWHGAAWTFVLWGLLHGVGLALTRAWQRSREGACSSANVRPSVQPLWRALSVLFTFHLVCLGWIVFRAPTVGAAWQILHGLARLSGGTANVTPLIWGVLLAGLATHALPTKVVEHVEAAAVAAPAWTQAVGLVAVLAGVRYLGTTKVAPFIYFQF